jgi:hypothetical protein
MQADIAFGDKRRLHARTKCAVPVDACSSISDWVDAGGSISDWVDAGGSISDWAACRAESEGQIPRGWGRVLREKTLPCEQRCIYSD